MKRSMFLPAVAGLLAASFAMGGCVSRGIKEAVGRPEGAVFPMQAVSTGWPGMPLGAYTRFELGKFTDDYGRTPAEFFTLLPVEFQTQLQKRGLPDNTTGKTLLIRGKVLQYETAGLMGQAFGPLEEVIARVEFVDAASGKVLGVANCVGRTNTTLEQGVKAKAEGLAKGLVKWIEDNYPKK